MANAFTFEVKGLKELQKKFERMPKVLVQELDGDLESFVQNVSLKAKQYAPKDKGALVQSINSLGSNLNYSIVELVRYGWYQEFGTGNKVRVPSEVSAYAAQAKGRGIRKINLTPQPHLFKAFFELRPAFLKNVSDTIKRIEQS